MTRIRWGKGLFTWNEEQLDATQCFWVFFPNYFTLNSCVLLHSVINRHCFILPRLVYHPFSFTHHNILFTEMLVKCNVFDIGTNGLFYKVRDILLTRNLVHVAVHSKLTNSFDSHCFQHVLKFVFVKHWKIIQICEMLS